MALLVLAGCAMLYFSEPGNSWWLPPCVFKTLTGLDCPSCGSTRALYALLHGHFAAALRYNPFILISWPVLAVLIYATIQKPRGAEYPRWVWVLVYVYIVLMLVWWVVRNL